MATATKTTDSAPSPIDLEHLASITFADKSLETEVLALFSRKASEALIAIERADKQDARREAAHRLVGAASAVGAHDLAASARRIETAAKLTGDDVAELANAMSAVVSFLEIRMGARV